MIWFECLLIVWMGNWMHYILCNARTEWRRPNICHHHFGVKWRRAHCTMHCIVLYHILWGTNGAAGGVVPTSPIFNFSTNIFWSFCMCRNFITTMHWTVLCLKSWIFVKISVPIGQFEILPPPPEVWQVGHWLNLHIYIGVFDILIRQRFWKNIKW